MKPIRLASLALLAIAISCGDGAGLAPEAAAPDQQPSDLHAARERWQAQHLHTYAFTLRRACFCGNVHPLYVAVLNDTVGGVIDLETGEQVDSRLGMTVDGLFAFIQSSIDNHAQLIRAQYDATKGFPTEIDYDGAAQIADDEIFFRASDVHPIFP